MEVVQPPLPQNLSHVSCFFAVPCCFKRYFDLGFYFFRRSCARLDKTAMLRRLPLMA